MNKLSSWPAVLCWLIVLLEGYDLVVPGTVIPTLIEQHHIGFTAARATFAATICSFMGLLLVYGLSTWLPKLMRDAGYNMSTASTLLLVLNVGVIFGPSITGWLIAAGSAYPWGFYFFAAAAGIGMLAMTAVSRFSTRSVEPAATLDTTKGFAL